MVNSRKDRLAGKAARLAWPIRCAAVVVPMLGGCALLNPAPYQPAGARSVAGEPPKSITPAGCPAPAANAANANDLLQFRDFDDASAKLCQLGAGYALVRNRVMGERLIFDVPAIGLGVAGVANGAFNGAKDLTLALGLGSAGFAGATSYFSPSTRIAAYGAAAQSLLCASGVSHQMSQENGADGLNAGSTLNRLAADIAAATMIISNGPVSGVTQAEINDLIAKRDTAVKSQTGLKTAYALLTQGPIHLEAFAGQVIGNTTSKLVSGTQSPDAVISLIKQQISGVRSGAGGGSGGAGASGAGTGLQAMALPFGEDRQKGRHGDVTTAKATTPTPQDVAKNLAQEAAQADDIAGRINDAWSNFAKCSAS